MITQKILNNTASIEEKFFGARAFYSDAVKSNVKIADFFS